MSIHTDVEIPEEVGNTAHAAAFMTSYLDSLTLVERLHRLLLDVIKDEFERVGVLEINAVQALLLFNVGDNEVTAGELKTRGYYQGSNVSYNLKKRSIWALCTTTAPRLTAVPYASVSPKKGAMSARSSRNSLQPMPQG